MTEKEIKEKALELLDEFLYFCRIHPYSPVLPSDAYRLAYKAKVKIEVQTTEASGLAD